MEATSKSLAAELKDVKRQLVEKNNQVVSSRSGVSEIEKTIAGFKYLISFQNQNRSARNVYLR